jgi:phosphoenolpyruvate-protein phosphotransferase (PTS system enzyme I)
VLACAEQSAGPIRSIAPEEIDLELGRFEGALARAEKELLALKQSVNDRLGAGEAEIFTAQAMVLRDDSFHQRVVNRVREGRLNAEAALTEVVEGFTRSFDKIPDPYLRERAADIRDVGRRVLSALLDRQVGPDCLEIPAGAIVVAEELLPSVTANLELSLARGLVIEHGGRFSHSAILARSMGTPAVVGIEDAARVIKTGDHVIVDGVSGAVFVNPEARVRSEYDRLESEFLAYRHELRQVLDLPSETLDGMAIPLLANVSKYADTEVAHLYNAEGIGLYRTEFGFSIRTALPTADEQYEFLARAAERFHPRPISLRLLDLGGDKQLPYLPLPPSRNPSLADRGIRVLLKHPEILESQLRAFLRVSADHPVGILVPVVGGLEEMVQFRRVLERVKEQLHREGQRFNAQVPIGAMVEVPSAALLIDQLARDVDFLSLGTNDLVQYLLAADREEESVAPHYQPLHPAVLRTIASVAAGADRAGKPLTICGEMAGEPRYLPLLLGLGLRRFSVAPGEMLAVKKAIRGLRLAEAQQLGRQALTLGTAAEVEALLDRHRPVATPAATHQNVAAAEQLTPR